jgi:hypothetical protein
MKYMWILWALILFIVVSWAAGFVLPMVPSFGNPLINSTVAAALTVVPFVYLWEKYVRKKAGGT